MSDERDSGYCAFCYGAAKKAGRPVKMTDVSKWPVCSLCESRLRNGLIHFVPSSGSEGECFFGRCEDCRHYTPNEYGAPGCAFGIANKVGDMMFEPSDSAKAWHDPADLEETGRCLRFTSKDDPNGALRDPPPKDCVGQMTFGELLTPVEPSHAERAGKAVTA